MPSGHKHVQTPGRNQDPFKCTADEGVDFQSEMRSDAFWCVEPFPVSSERAK